MVLACWMVGDVHHSIGLARQLDVDIRSAQGKDWPQQIAEFYGPEAAWAHASLLDRTPEGATFAVAGDNVTTMAQRLAYWLAPQRTFVADWRKADFVLVFRPGEATWDEADGRFTSGSQSVAAERLATRDANLYLLRRLAQ
jgi:hypothetical protein